MEVTGRILHRLLLILLLENCAACRNTCGNDDRIGENLRSHFTSCMKKNAGNTFNWAYLVNYVVWDDVWFSSAYKFYCRNQTLECWIGRIKYLLKSESPHLQHVQHCVKEYAGNMSVNASSAEAVQCEPTENPVHVPIIFMAFKVIRKCPSKYGYVYCLTSAIQWFNRHANKADSRIIPEYDITQLSTFIMEHRSNCRIKRVKWYQNEADNTTIVEYNTTCPIKHESDSAIMSNLTASPQDVTGEKNSPPKKSANRPTSLKCFARKLQTVLKAHSVLTAAASKCNYGTQRQKSPQRYEGSMQAHPESGTIGECQNGTEWTQWYNNDNPESGNGDLEQFSRIRNKNPRDICVQPSAVQALQMENGRPYTEAKQKVVIGPLLGLICLNYLQADKQCLDYKIRFCCPKN